MYIGTRTVGMPANHIDLAYLARFCKGDRSRMERYIHLYLDSAPGLLSELLERAKTGDAEGLAAAAHGLRPQVNFMGARQLFDLLTEIEQLARQKGAGACGEQVSLLTELNREVMAELQKVLEAE